MLFLVLGPTLIGGRCYDKPGKKDCGSDCIPREQPCNGTCRHDQCQTKNKTCVELLDINRFSSMRHIDTTDSTDFYSSQNGYWKNCHGVCIEPRDKCDEKCGAEQCEDAEGACVDPELDRTEAEKELGLYPVKSCEGVCVGATQLCSNSCGHSSQFCWSPHTSQCLSVREKSETVCRYLGQSDVRNNDVLKTGQMLRRSCGCVCIPYASRCEGRCGRGQCLEAGQCVSELERDDQGRRLRRACNEECSAWTAQCTHEWS